MKICTHGHSIQWLFSLNYDKEGNHLLRGCMWPRYSQSLVLADGVSIYLSLLSMLQTQGRHLWYSPKSTHWGLILTLSHHWHPWPQGETSAILPLMKSVPQSFLLRNSARVTFIRVLSNSIHLYNLNNFALNLNISVRIYSMECFFIYVF